MFRIVVVDVVVVVVDVVVITSVITPARACAV